MLIMCVHNVDPTSSHVFVSSNPYLCIPYLEEYLEVGGVGICIHNYIHNADPISSIYVFTLLFFTNMCEI